MINVVQSSGPSDSTKRLDFTVTSAVLSGQIVIFGEVPGVAVAAYATGTKGTFLIGQVIRYAKAAVSFAEGAKVYFDSGANEVTNTDGGGSNKEIGVAIEDETTSVVFRMFERIPSAGGGGGGGTALPVLTSDPGSPSEDEQWFLYSGPIDGTFLTSGGDESQSGLEWIDPGAHTVANLQAAFSDQAQFPNFELAIIDGGAFPAVTDLNNVQYESGVTTLTQLRDAINAFANPIFGSNVVQFAAGKNGFEILGVQTNEQTQIVAVAQGAGNYDGTHLVFSEQFLFGPGYIWFNLDSLSSDPDPFGGQPGIEVAVTTGMTAGQVGDAIAAAITTATSGGDYDGVLSLVSNNNAGTVVFQELSGQDVTDSSNVDSPTTVSTPQQGGTLGDSNSLIESDAQSDKIELKIFKAGKTYSTLFN